MVALGLEVLALFSILAVPQTKDSDDNVGAGL